MAAPTPSTGVLGQFSMADLNFFLINKFFVLLVVLLFFTVIIILRRYQGREVPAVARTSLKLSIFGLVLLYFEITLTGLSSYRVFLESIQSIIVLVCLAKLTIYITLDVVLALRRHGEVPMLLRDAIRLAVYLAAGIVSLRLVLNVDISSVITTTTVLTAAIAFALQNTLANAFNGFTVQIDSQMPIGSWITIPEKNLFGLIVNVGFRYTTLRTLDNNLVMVPNTLLVQSVVSTHGNSSTPAPERSALTTTIALPYELPPEQARALLLGVLHEERLVLNDPPPQVRLQTLADSSINYLLRFWIADPALCYIALDAVQTKCWYAVHRAGWGFPYPHRQIISSEPRKPLTFSREDLLIGLLQSPLFGVLNDQEATFLAEGAAVKYFAPGEAAVRQGDPGSSLFFILQGEMQVMVDGHEVAILGAGRMFGEMSLLTGDPRRATVRARKESVLAEISKESLSSLLKTHEKLLEAMSETLARHEAEINAHKANLQESEEVAPRASDYLSRLREFFGRR